MEKRKKDVVTAVGVIVALTVISAISVVQADTYKGSSDCPNGPMFAELAAPPGTGTTLRGTARYRDQNSNALMVRVNGPSTSANTVLDVSIAGTVVGQITLQANGNGDLKLDDPGAAITEGTAITLSTGGNAVLAGTFACVAGAGRRPNETPTPTVDGTPEPTPTVAETPTPTVEPTVSPTVTPDPTETPTPTVTPTPAV